MENKEYTSLEEAICDIFGSARRVAGRRYVSGGDSKDAVDSPMDEILKDADVIHHSLGDPTKDVKEYEKARYEKLCKEFGFIYETRN